MFAARAIRLAGTVALLALGSAAARPVSPGARVVPPPPQYGALAARGAQLLAANECARCHESRAIPELAALPRTESCSGCHRWVHDATRDAVESARERQVYPLWDRYRTSVKHLLAVPDLGASGARLDPAWVADYLQHPWKVRPALGEEMIRTPISSGDAEAIAARLAAARPPLTGVAADAAVIPFSSATADVATGRALYDSLHCAACHAFGARAAQPGIPAAPDLAQARDRMRPADIAAFIADPSAFGAITAMPSFELSAEQAARLRDYLVATPIVAPVADAIPAELPLLPRDVSWDEVYSRVFGAVCIHCHMDEEANAGQGGPGNTGGLGYRGAGLAFESWAGVVRGARRPDGTRVSILVPGAGEPDAPLLARLRERYVENAHERAGRAATEKGGVPGMPLGMPALSPEDFQLVRTWLADGAPGPDGRLAISRTAPSQEEALLRIFGVRATERAAALTCVALPSSSSSSIASPFVASPAPAVLAGSTCPAERHSKPDPEALP